ncbi:hypothetical protein Ddc_18415 [Ditylenchus destructor]|nr:hypothetical protein Ddc_18415 [Ditylenchus destructor]
MRRPFAQTNPRFHAALSQFRIPATQIAHSISSISVRFLLLHKAPEMLIPHFLRMPQPNAQGLFVDRRPSRASRAQSPSYVTRALGAPTFNSEMAAVLNLFRASDSSPGCAFYRGFSLLRAQLWFQPLRCPSSTEPLTVFVL